MSVEESLHYQNSLSLWFTPWLSFSPVPCSLKSTQSFPLNEPKGSEGSKRVREPMEVSLLEQEHHGEEWRMDLEGQMEDHQYKSPSCFL